jgi:hypothetical protein
LVSKTLTIIGLALVLLETLLVLYSQTVMWSQQTPISVSLRFLLLSFVGRLTFDNVGYWYCRSETG